MRLWTLARRELLGSTRRRLPWFLRIICLAGMAVCVYAGAGDGTLIRPYYAPGVALFGSLVVVMWCVLGALALFLSFGSVSREKETRTAELLLVTGLKPRDIVLGEFLGSLGLPILLLAASLPPAMVALALGGLSGEIVAITYGGTLSLVVLIVTFGCLAGAAGSLLLAFLLVGAYLALPPVLVVLLGFHGLQGFFELTWLPYALVEAAFDQTVLGTELAASLCTTAALSVSSLMAASFLMRPRPGIALRLKGLLRRARLGLVRLNDKLFRGAVIGEGFARTVRERWPLFWRELRRSLFTGFFFQLVFGGAVVAVWLAAFGLLVTVSAIRGRSWDAHEAFEVMRGVLVVFFLLVPGALLARAFVREKRSGTLALMLAAPTSERRILGSHVASVLWSVWSFAAVLLLHELLGALFDGIVGRAGWAAAALALTSLVFSLGCGAFCGVFFKNTVRSLAAYALILAAWYGGAAVLAVIAEELGLLGLEDFCYLLCPVDAFESVLDFGAWGAPEYWLSPALGCILGVFGLVFAARGMRARACR